MLPGDPWVSVGEKDRQYDSNSDLDSGLSEGKLKSIQLSVLFPCTSYKHDTRMLLVTEEGGSICLGKQASGLSPVHKVEKVWVFQHDCMKEEVGG